MAADKRKSLLHIAPEHFIPAPDQAPRFAPMLQGRGTNEFARIHTHVRGARVDEVTGAARITEGDLTVFVEEYNDLTGGLRISTHKLLDACTIALTAQNHYRGHGEPNTQVIIPLDEYMQRCGIAPTKPNKDKLRRRVREDLEALYNTSLEWRESAGRKESEFAKMRICDMVALRGGNIMLNFSKNIANYLINAYVMQYPNELFKLDERNSNAWTLARKLALHNSMDQNRRLGTANIIAVRTLLTYIREIPSYEEVMSKGRQLEQRIIAPLENALKALAPVLSWEYCNSKGMPLTDEQRKQFDYSVFVECYVHFVLHGAPDQTKRLAGKAVRKASVRRKDR